MKYFIFSDVHGFYSILNEKLKEVGFDENNEKHMLISLGDNFDRGKENYEMFLFLKKMKEKNKIILIKGNHEDLFISMLTRNYSLDHDIHNYTYDTLNQFYHVITKQEEDNISNNNFGNMYNELKNIGLLDLIYDMKDYYETNNYVFIHGFIPVLMNGINSFVSTNFKYNPNWRNATKDDFEKSRWFNGIDMSIYYHIKEPNKKIVIGHKHCSYGNVRKDLSEGLSSYVYKINQRLKFEYNDPYIDDNIIAIDAGTFLSKKVNVLVIDD